MSHQLRVDDFVEELRKYDRKDDFMAVMRQYEQRYYDQFEQYANNNFPPELQRQQKQEQQWRSQAQVPLQKPPVVRSSSANKIEYQDTYQAFPQQFIPQRPPSRGEVQDPFKRPQDQYDFRTSPVAQQDPFRGPPQQQYQQKQMMQGPQMGLFSPFQTPQNQQPVSQVPLMQQPIPQQFPTQMNPQIGQQYIPQQLFEQQPYQQQYQTYQKGGPNQQMDAFLTEIKQQRMMKQQQQK